MNTHNVAASQGSGYSGQQLLTGEEAQKVLGEILESERRSRSLTYPAHTGAQGYFRDGAKYVAFDNSTNDCWVEEFRTKTGAEKWCRGLMDTDMVHEFETSLIRDRHRSRELYAQCVDMAKQLNCRISGGDSDGVAYFMDKPCIVSFTEDERSGWLNRFAEEELVLGVYFSDNRIVPADFVILQRGNRIDAEQLPPYGLNLYTKLASTMKAFAEDANHARSHAIRVMDNDSTRNFTLAEVVPTARKADKPRALEDAPHFETFLHALEYSRRRLLSQSGISCSELECPKGPVEGIILNRDSFPVLGGKGLSSVDTLPPYVKFDDSGEFAIDMEFHDGFAYDTNPHGLGFYDRVALYYPTLEELRQDPAKLKAVQNYTGRQDVTPFDVALKFGQASRMRCPDYRYDAAKKALVERTTDPSAREFSPEQRKAIELAADCGGFYLRPKGRDFFYEVLFSNSEKAMGNIPDAWKADVKAELRGLARGEVRDVSVGLHR